MRGWDKGLWQRLSPMLDRALDLDPDEQARFLSAVRSEDPDAAAALERLLAEHDQVLASAFLETPLLAGVAPASLAGQTVGAYTLERPIGMGGMGMVWLARRSDGRFEGTAAVKFVNLALLDAAGQARFRREGTLLARLSHPNIARLLDAGVTAAGQPFLVLEYVEGTPIDRFAADRRLGIDARLTLFLQVAGAVAHAHSNLVVHRDLKPSNVLVDSHGQVKLLDFGVCHAARERRIGQTRAGGCHRPCVDARVRRARAADRRQHHHGDRRLCAGCDSLPAADRVSPHRVRRFDLCRDAASRRERRATAAQ